MKLRVWTHQLIRIIEIEGEIHLADANRLKELVMKMIETKTERFIIDAEKITAIDSSGIGAFIFISSTLKKLNLALAIANVSGPVQQVIDTIKLADYFLICKNLHEAIQELSRIK
jgi:anti-sigma B factor antagonist